jgi:amino acid adenylation domain-containing protein
MYAKERIYRFKRRLSVHRKKESTSPNFVGVPNPSLPLSKLWHGSIISKFGQHVSRRVAIETSEECWSYEDLDFASKNLSQYILSHRLSKDNRWGSGLIAVYAKRTAALVVSLLGIMRAGFAFVVLDPSYPGSRLARYIRLVRPGGLLNIGGQPLTEQVRTALTSWRNTLLMDVPESRKDLLLWCKSEGPLDHKEPKDSGPDDILYIAFTSGTTGSPRAIVGSHCPVSHFFEWQQRNFELTKDDRISVLSGLGHDPLLRDILMPLWVGAAICIPTQDCYEVPNRLYEWMLESRVSVIHLTPSLGQLLLVQDVGPTKEKLRDLRYAFFGGDILRFRLVRTLAQCAPRVTIVNCYGTTETPQVVGYHTLKPYVPHISRIIQSSESVVPIGKGIDNSQLLILNEKGNLCKKGEIGEIYVRSPYLAKEIIDESGPCQNAFVPNPYTHMESDCLYKTGDVGYYQIDGSVIFKGRKDRQIKLRGYRIELGEIDEIVAQDESILEHYIDVEGERDVEKRIVLYVARKKDSICGPDELRKLLMDNLPKYMVPDRIIDLPRLPLTPNGKVDRAKLREMQLERKRFAGLKKGGLSHDLESELINIFSNGILDRDITLDDSISDIGIDSLHVVYICFEIEKVFGVRLGAPEIFAHNDIRSLANYIASRRSEMSEGLFLYTSTGDDLFLDSKSPEFADGQVEYFAETCGTTSAGIIGENPGPKLFPKNERPLIAIKNRLLQLIARVAPDLWRAKLHRMRGVRIGEHVSIGYDSLIETSYPWLVRIGDNVNIGIRTTIIAHFRGMAPISKDNYTVDIQNGAFIGPGVFILPNVTIGEGAVVAAGSVVNNSVPAYTLVQGNPAIPKARCGVALTGKTQYDEFIRKLVPIRKDR